MDKLRGSSFKYLISQQEAQEIYRKCQWPNLQRFQRQKCRKLLVEMQDRLTAEDTAERERRSATTSET